MRRQLIRLFVLIIASCALIVWSFNLIYSASEEAYGYSLDVEALLAEGQLEFKTLPANTIAFSKELTDKLANGKIISLSLDSGEQYFYQQNPDGSLRQMGPVPMRNGSGDITPLIPLLYASLALAILLLIGRVFKDLSLLQSQAVDFGRHPKRLKTGIGPRSAIYPLAQGFETMTAQIMDFLRLHRDLSRTMSHEIRTPLSRMRFVLELSKDNLPGDYLNRLSQDIDQIEELTKNYLSFARVEHQQGEQTRDWQDADAFISALLEKFSVYQSAITLEGEVDCKLTAGKVLLDPLSMDLAGQNLIANALKYADKQIRITLVAEPRHWCLTVEDDGPGIADTDKDLRQAFQRGSSPNSSGYGLGLYIVRKIAIWHQGKLRVNNSGRLGGAAISLRWRRPVF
ncbi:ATP-binding protein [Shewanella khirikhana]|uniref:sensor histidine kinase n=1 Tax=Shewanella khirikhana TaxID=1965282 RepID=UPI0030CD5E0C